MPQCASIQHEIPDVRSNTTSCPGKKRLFACNRCCANQFLFAGGSGGSGGVSIGKLCRRFIVADIDLSPQSVEDVSVLVNLEKTNSHR